MEGGRALALLLWVGFQPQERKRRLHLNGAPHRLLLRGEQSEVVVHIWKNAHT